MIITILLTIAFLVLLAKAIFETIWGLCMIAFGLCMHAVAFLLDGMALAVRACKWVSRLVRKPQPKAKRVNVARAFVKYYAGAN